MSFTKEVKEELSKYRSKSKALTDAQKRGFSDVAPVKGAGAGKNKSSFTEPAEKVIIRKEKPCVSELSANERKAYLRGALLCGGYFAEPSREYYMEISAPDKEKAEGLILIMEGFGLHPKIWQRRGAFVVYLKEGEDISLILSICRANVSMMKFENIRIERELRGNANRRTNCDTANITKTVDAAQKRIADIRLVMESPEYEGLDVAIKSMAEARLENPDMSLEELGLYMTPPVSKSAVNHRLRKISALAQDIRNKKQQSKR